MKLSQHRIEVLASDQPTTVWELKYLARQYLELQAELAAARADAARYRWMRDTFRMSNWYAKFFLLNGSRFDAAVDDEIAKEEK